MVLPGGFRFKPALAPSASRDGHTYDDYSEQHL
jgi:hypothetical protein